MFHFEGAVRVLDTPSPSWATLSLLSCPFPAYNHIDLLRVLFHRWALFWGFSTRYSIPSIPTPLPSTISFISSECLPQWILPRCPCQCWLLCARGEAYPSIGIHTLICHYKFISVIILSASGCPLHQEPHDSRCLVCFSHPCTPTTPRTALGCWMNEWIYE